MGIENSPIITTFRPATYVGVPVAPTAIINPSFEQTAFVVTESGELQEQRRAHREELEEFYPAND
jgi:hypothetical protein